MSFSHLALIELSKSLPRSNMDVGKLESLQPVQDRHTLKIPPANTFICCSRRAATRPLRLADVSLLLNTV